MKFKVKNTELIFSFSFFALLAIFTATKNAQILYISFTTSFIHEIIHLLFILLTGAGVECIKFSLFGGNIKRTAIHLSDYKEAIISLSAPLYNIIIGLILLLHNKNSIWGQVNLLTGLFNITPFYNFDGGRGIYYLLRSKVKTSRLKMIATFLSVLIFLFFLLINIYLITSDKINITLCFVCAFMFFSLISNYLKQKNTL